MRFTEIHQTNFIMQRFNYTVSHNLHQALAIFIPCLHDEDCEIALQMSLNEPHYWLDFCDYVERGNASGEISESNGMLDLTASE